LIILSAVTGLIQVHALRHIWRFSRAEFAVSMVSLAGVLGSGLLNGVLLGVVLSIFLLIRRASRPRVIELGRVPGSSYFADLDHLPENERADDTLIVRSEGSLLYFNVDHVRDRLTTILNQRAVPPRLVVFVLGNVPYVDLAGAECVTGLHATLLRRGIAFRLAEVHGQVREALRRLDPSHTLAVTAHQTVVDVLAQWHATDLAAAASRAAPATPSSPPWSAS